MKEVKGKEERKEDVKGKEEKRERGRGEGRKEGGEVERGKQKKIRE